MHNAVGAGLIWGLAAVALFEYGALHTGEPATAQSASAAKSKYGAFGLDMAGRDPAIKPGDDFWAFTNGGWASRTAQADSSAMTQGEVGYDKLVPEEAELNVRRILDEAVADRKKFGETGAQVGDFYASWMDSATIERRGITPLKPYLARIDAVSDLSGLQTLFATSGFSGPVEIGILPDFADPTHYVMAVSQNGLSMPRDYYLNASVRLDNIRTAYRTYIAKMLTLAGVADASAKADAVFALETAMAGKQWSAVERRNLARINDPETIAGLAAKAPEFDWALLFKTAGFDKVQTVLMADNTAVTAMGKILATTPVQTWKDYLTFHFISDHATALPQAFDDARFEFFGRALSGAQTQPDRWKRGLSLLNRHFGEAVGKLYVERHFPATSETRVGELVENLRNAYRIRITDSEWMDDESRKAALVKITRLKAGIGHPENYIDYSTIHIDNADLFGNIVRSEEFERQQTVRQFRNPIDPGRWGIAPQIANAYYSPLANQAIFTAAILQPPFFDANADPAVNYGSTGAIIGRVFNSGFDGEGSRFGADGKLHTWWTPATTEAFKKRAGPLVVQYDAYEPVPGGHINGTMTFAENVDDLAGLEIAYAAFQIYQTNHGVAPVLGGLTGDQRFFLSYAQTWRTRRDERAIRARLATDPHSPVVFRVNGVVRNMDAWYKAFDVKPGDALYLPPDARVHIW